MSLFDRQTKLQAGPSAPNLPSSIAEDAIHKPFCCAEDVIQEAREKAGYLLDWFSIYGPLVGLKLPRMLWPGSKAQSDVQQT